MNVSPFAAGRLWSAGQRGPCHNGHRPGGEPGRQPWTVIPIDRAVPAMIFSAASTELALRSGILVCAISRTWAAVIVPTLLTWGCPLPFATPAAFLISSGAGGVLV